MAYKEPDWIKQRKKLWGQEAGRGFSWREEGGFWNDSDNRRNYERAKDDYLRKMQGKAKDLTKDVWAKVMTGEFNVDDFQGYLGSQTGIVDERIKSGHFGSLKGTWGQWGGYDKDIWGTLEKKEKLREQKVSEKQLQPGAYQQTRGGVLDGLMRNTAKQTILGKY